MWQTLHEELYLQGLQIVTVALDILGARAASPFIEAAKATHPSLIDEAHLLDELFGIVNVPSSIWIDEQGMLVRPPEPSNLPRARRGFKLADNMSPYLVEKVKEANKITETLNARQDSEKYVAALRDWAAKGSASRYALTPEEVLSRSHPRPLEEAQAAAHFELGQYLYRQGQTEAAIAHFRQAHRLQPDNWTYRRQAWSMANSLEGPTEWYDGDWVGDIKKAGAENYYPALEMD